MTQRLVAVRDLNPIHRRENAADRPALRRLSDAGLLAACFAPDDGSFIILNTRTGGLMNGNGRAFELRRRSESPSSIIGPDTLVPCELHEPDMSMFADLPDLPEEPDDDPQP